MKRMRVCLTVLLTLLLMVSSFAGCGQGQASSQEAASQASESSASGESKESTAPAASSEAQPEEEGEKVYTEDEYYKITLVGGNEDKSTLDSKIGRYIADKFGLVFEYVNYPGDYWEYLALQLAGGTYGEMVWLQQDAGFKPYSEAGVLLNLDDYKDILPDFYKYYEEQIPYWRARTADGGLYGWDFDTPKKVTTANYWDVAVRSDVLEYYGYPELVYASDWIAFMEKALKDFPTTYDGVTPTTGIHATFGESYGIQGFTHGGADKGDRYEESNDYYAFDFKEGRYVDQFVDVPEIKESVQFWNECYQKGLLDLESFTDTDDQQVSKMSIGQPIVIWYTAWNNSAANKALTEAGHPEMSYVTMPFQLDSQKGQLRRNNASIVNFDATYALTKNCKDPERLLKFINWCCTEEGQLLLQSGIEGEHYIINSEGLREPTELRLQIAQDTELAASEGLPQKNIAPYRGLPQGAIADANGIPYNFAKDQVFLDNYGLTDREREVYYEGLKWESSKGWWINHRSEPTNYDTGNISIPGDTPLGKLGVQLTECYTRNVPGIIMSDDFEGAWSNFMEQYEKYDYASVRDEMNRLLDEYNAAKDSQS